MRPLLLILVLPTVSLALQTPDLTKRVVERPTEKVLQASKPGDVFQKLAAVRNQNLRAARSGPGDAGKTALEAPTKVVVANTSTDPAAATKGQQPNPGVKPGNVNWLPSFERACVASQQSGKPVLLFHLMGKLDERFT